MTPDQVRSIFTKRFQNRELVTRAVKATLSALEKEPMLYRRSRSDWALHRLTDGLPHADEILDLALRLKATRSAPSPAEARSARLAASRKAKAPAADPGLITQLLLTYAKAQEKALPHWRFRATRWQHQGRQIPDVVEQQGGVEAFVTRAVRKMRDASWT